MALYEYRCEDCGRHFEVIHSMSEPTVVECDRCRSPRAKKLISGFAIGGQGDQRESTFHGCHDAHVPHDHKSHESHGSDEDP